jgi:hypothetical protein
MRSSRRRCSFSCASPTGPWRGGRSTLEACAGGLLLGVALQVKHVALAETALFFAGVLVVAGRAGWARAAGVVIAAGGAFLLPSLLAVGYFWLEGLAPQYFQAVIGANLAYLAARPSILRSLSELPASFVLPPLGVIAAAALVLWRRPARQPLFLLAWAAAAGIDAALPAHFFPHYFLLIMPAAALLAGYLAAVARAAWPRWSAAAVPVAVALIANPLGIYGDAAEMRAWHRRDVPATVAKVIRPHLAPGESIFVFNYQPVVYFLTRATPPTRHVFPDDWSQGYRNVTGLVAEDELGRVFGARPEFVVFVDRDWNHIGPQTFSRLHDHLASSYEKRFEIADDRTLPIPAVVEVYRRKPEGADHD